MTTSEVMRSSQSQLRYSHCIMCLLFLNCTSQSHTHRMQHSLLEDNTPCYTPLHEANGNHRTFIQHQSALFLQSVSKTMLFSWTMNGEISDFKVCYGEKERRNSIFKWDAKVEKEEATEQIGGNCSISRNQGSQIGRERVENYKQEKSNEGTRPVT